VPAVPTSTSVSLTEILDWIDPTALPERIQDELEEVGPLLAHGLTYREIAERIGGSEDYVAAAVHRIRAALVDEALTRADEMSEALRARLEELAAKQRRSDRPTSPSLAAKQRRRAETASEPDTARARPTSPATSDRHEAEHRERLRLHGEAPLSL